MAGEDGIRPLDDRALAQVWGGVTFQPQTFPLGGGTGVPLENLPNLRTSLPFFAGLPDTTVVTPSGQVSHSGGTAPMDGSQDP